MTDLKPEDVKLFLFNNTLFALIFFAIGLVVTWIAYIRGFFSLPHKEHKGAQVTAYDLLCSYGIFLAVYLLVPNLFLRVFSTGIANHRPLFISLLQLSIFLFTVIFLALYNLLRDRATVLHIWKDPTFPDSKSLSSNLLSAWTTLVVAAPFILAIAHLSEVIRVLIWGYSTQEQLAILYLKQALASPTGMVFAFIAILVLAPCLEEYLFRGLLQSWLRRKIGPVKAIFASAVLFGVFHFSASQSTTNLPLILTLSVFALYLGFLYEKTRSLFATIFLHVTFNCISVIRIIFTEV